MPEAIELGEDELREIAWAAFRAARESPSPAAGAAGRAASLAAAAAYLHPPASASQVRHVLGAAAHAARAGELAAAHVPAGTLEEAVRSAPPAVAAVLRRLPAAPPGGGRVGELARELDAALRA